MGFNLIESAIVLGVVGLVIGAIWVASAKFYEDYKVNKTVEGVLSASRNIQNLISIRDAAAIGWEGATTTMAVAKAAAFPEDWVNKNAINYTTILKHPFGGRIQVTNTGPSYFWIGLFGLPVSACVKLVVNISNIEARARAGNPSRVNSLQRIMVNDAPHFSTTTFPVSIQTASTAACDQELNDATFSFGYTRTN